jgi:hypothetical protein
MAAVLAVTAGLLTPAGPALAAEATQAGAIATEATAEPVIELEPGAGNTVTVTMTNGIGLTARVNITIGDKDSVWTAPAPATTATYTIVASYGASASGVVRLQAVALKNGAEVAWGGNWTVWTTPALPPPPPVAPKIDFVNYDDASLPAKTLQFSGMTTGKTGTSIALQRNDAGVWKTVWTSRPLGATESWAQFTAYTFKTEGTAPFRALLLSAGKTLSTSPTRTLAYKRMATNVFAPFSAGGKPFGTADGRVAAKTQWSDTYQLSYAATSRTGRLQEYRGGKWVTLQTMSFTKANNFRAAVKTPLTAGTVVRKYRVSVDGTAQEKAWTSATSTIEHVDPARYTGYKKASYDYMKRYCPNQVITLIPGQTSYAHSLSRQIQMATGIPDQTALKFVSLHECAHILSFKVYSDYNQLVKRMNAIYGTRTAPGVEQLADCMASAMGGDIRRSGYRTTNCTGARADAARKILAGKKP